MEECSRERDEMAKGLHLDNPDQLLSDDDCDGYIDQIAGVKSYGFPMRNCFRSIPLSEQHSKRCREATSSDYNAMGIDEDLPIPNRLSVRLRSISLSEQHSKRSREATSSDYNTMGRDDDLPIPNRLALHFEATGPSRCGKETGSHSEDREGNLAMPLICVNRNKTTCPEWCEKKIVDQGTDRHSLLRLYKELHEKVAALNIHFRNQTNFLEELKETRTRQQQDIEALKASLVKEKEAFEYLTKEFDDLKRLQVENGRIIVGQEGEIEALKASLSQEQKAFAGLKATVAKEREAFESLTASGAKKLSDLERLQVEKGRIIDGQKEEIEALKASFSQEQKAFEGLKATVAKEREAFAELQLEKHEISNRQQREIEALKAFAATRREAFEALEVSAAKERHVMETDAEMRRVTLRESNKKVDQLRESNRKIFRILYESNLNCPVMVSDDDSHGFIDLQPTSPIMISDDENSEGHIHEGPVIQKQQAAEQRRTAAHVSNSGKVERTRSALKRHFSTQRKILKTLQAHITDGCDMKST